MDHRGRIGYGMGWDGGANLCNKFLKAGIALLLAWACCMAPICSHAFVFNYRAFDEQHDIRVSVSTTASQFRNRFMSALDSWESICSYITISDTQGDNIYLYSDTGVDNDAYAVCYYVDDETNNIVLYRPFTRLSVLQQDETIVHEIGHAMGLDHCQEEKNEISVMRRLGFNSKPYPLADDIEGINILYGW